MCIDVVRTVDLVEIRWENTQEVEAKHETPATYLVLKILVPVCKLHGSTSLNMQICITFPFPWELSRIIVMGTLLSYSTVRTVRCMNHGLYGTLVLFASNDQNSHCPGSVGKPHSEPLELFRGCYMFLWGSAPRWQELVSGSCHSVRLSRSSALQSVTWHPPSLTLIPVISWTFSLRQSVCLSIVTSSVLLYFSFPKSVLCHTVVLEHISYTACSNIVSLLFANCT